MFFSAIFIVIFFETILARLLGTSLLTIMGISEAARYMSRIRKNKTTYVVDKRKYKASNQDTFYEDS